jgi:hypothetical protein
VRIKNREVGGFAHSGDADVGQVHDHGGTDYADIQIIRAQHAPHHEYLPGTGKNAGKFND